ncbi:hypothetical protein D3C72_1402890 [compost metagenome]
MVEGLEKPHDVREHVDAGLLADQRVLVAVVAEHQQLVRGTFAEEQVAPGRLRSVRRLRQLRRLPRQAFVLAEHALQQPEALVRTAPVEHRVALPVQHEHRKAEALADLLEADRMALPAGVGQHLFACVVADLGEAAHLHEAVDRIERIEGVLADVVQPHGLAEDGVGPVPHGREARRLAQALRLPVVIGVGKGRQQAVDEQALHARERGSRVELVDADELLQVARHIAPEAVEGRGAQQRPHLRQHHRADGGMQPRQAQHRHAEHGGADAMRHHVDLDGRRFVGCRICRLHGAQGVRNVGLGHLVE